MTITKTIRELLRKHGVNKGKKLTNGGFQFAYRGHRVEIYKADKNVLADTAVEFGREVKDLLVFAYNDGQMSDGCWEFVYGDFERMDECLKTPESLWGW